MLGRGLAEQIGASALLYAAIAYFVFDESFFLEDISENYPELEEPLIWWCDDIYSTFYTIFENLRKFYETTGTPPRFSTAAAAFKARRPFRLLGVTYYEPDEDVFISASRDPSDDQYGSVWRVPEGRHQSLLCDWAEYRADLQHPQRSY